MNDCLRVENNAIAKHRSVGISSLSLKPVLSFVILAVMILNTSRIYLDPISVMPFMVLDNTGSKYLQKLHSLLPYQACFYSSSIVREQKCCSALEISLDFPNC